MSFLALAATAATNAATTTAMAAQKAPVQHSSILSMVALPLLLLVVLYFLMIRPQTKRAKEHRKLMGNIELGDEVLTTGGIAGKVIALRDSFIKLEVGRGSELVVQKSSIASVLPKGTLDAV